MEAKDLRIGNLVNHGKAYQNRYENPTEISWMDLEDTNGYEPIQLTEEWLLKFGFIKKLGNYELENFRFHVNKPMNYDGFLFCEGYSVITDRINFVHQLQNLYFALTNEELKLNL